MSTMPPSPSLTPPPAPLLASLEPEVWAEATFGAADLGDVRRTRRLVRTAAALAAQPTASLPRQLADWAALKAAYRLLATETVTFAAILAPHLARTRAAAAAAPVTLLVQDTTELDFTPHRATTGLAPIGNGRGRGFHLQTVLAVQPEPRLPLGVVAAEPWLRQPAPHRGETSRDRQQRPRESDVWGRLVHAVGAPPPGAATRWVHVADRGADCFTFFAACQATGTDFLTRITQNRRVTLAEGRAGRLVEALRAEPARARRTLALPARPKRPARPAEVAVSWLATTVEPSAHGPKGAPKPEPIPVWAVRVWEVAPEPGVKEPVEWLLLTSVPVAGVTDAWERADWYASRWVIEEFHHGLKSGCRAEAARLRDRNGLWRRLALLLPLAVRLLLLRELTRQTPAAPASQIADPVTIQVVAARTGQPAATTVGEFARQVARLGGHLGRTGDGPPGWQTLWAGWLYVQILLEGMRLAATLPDP